MRFDVVTLFPEMIRGALGFGVAGRAIETGIVELALWNPRDFTRNRHRTVDDRPYGGGPGMVMKVEPLRAAIRAARCDSDAAAKVIFLSPQGGRLTQHAITGFSTLKRLVLVAGRYEGVDERLLESEIDEEWSIGDYVISGGELAALVLIDAVTRLLPGALGDAQSPLEDSYMGGLLDYPHYTRPERIDEMTVPEVLRTGDHAAINRWRRKQALGRTWLRRPDLLKDRALNQEQIDLLEEFMQEAEQESSQTEKSVRNRP